MTSKRTKAKRRNIPTFTIAELEDAGRLPPYSYLMDPLDKWLEQDRATGTKMAQTSIDRLVEQLPDAANRWKEQKADFEEAEKSFDTRI